MNTTDYDLLQTVLGSDLAARDVLAAYGSLDKLLTVSATSLQQSVNLDSNEAARLAAAVELGTRALTTKSLKGAEVSSSQDIFEMFQHRLRAEKRERFLALGLNPRNEVLVEAEVAVGSVNECQVYGREVFRPLIIEAASRVVLIHNHPSGNPTPSPFDVSLTKNLIKLGDLLNMPILDHVIIAGDSYSSLRDLGLMCE